MIVLNSLEEAQNAQIRDVGITIGNFDGCHLGHRQLINKLHEELPAGADTLIITFDPLPEQILSPNPPLRLYPMSEQVKQFEQCGISNALVINFNKSIANIEAREFAQAYIFETFKPRVVVVGYDFAFGHKRVGNVELLKDMAVKYNCRVIQVEALQSKGEIISSSRIRNSIKNGQVELAAELLGRPFSLTGVVVKGRQLGRQLGFPTANLKCEWETYPKPGVYVCAIPTLGEKQYGVCNVGYSPTVTDASALRVECYLLDFNRDIYGETLQVHFLKQLRDEKKFPNQEVLRSQIEKDVLEAKKFLEM